MYLGTGGGLVEAIVRHMVRIAGAEEESGGHGLVCMVWVKAHGGGVAPNAYADAIAKSHLSAEVHADEVDAPLLRLPRACVYAVRAPAAPGRVWEPTMEQRTCVAGGARVGGQGVAREGGAIRVTAGNTRRRAPGGVVRAGGARRV